jgi:hypothetical protein
MHAMYSVNTPRSVGYSHVRIRLRLGIFSAQGHECTRYSGKQPPYVALCGETAELEVKLLQVGADTNVHVRSCRGKNASARSVRLLAPLAALRARHRSSSSLAEESASHLCRNARTRSFLTRCTRCKVCGAKGTNVYVRSCARGVGSSPAHDSRRSQPGRKAVSPRGQY